MVDISMVLTTLRTNFYNSSVDRNKPQNANHGIKHGIILGDFSSL